MRDKDDNEARIQISKIGLAIHETAKSKPGFAVLLYTDTVLFLSLIYFICNKKQYC